MQTLNLPGVEVRLYDSPHKLPESQRTLYSYYQSIHCGVGSTMQDVDRHFDPMLILAGANDTTSLMTAVNNLRYLFFGLLNKQIAPNILALCCLVESVNGEKWTDYTEKGLEELTHKLSRFGLCQEHAEYGSEMYSKEILKPLIRDFPAYFNDGEEEVEDRQRRMLLLMLDEIRDPEDETLDVRRKGIETEIAEAAQPPLMNGKNAVPDSIRDAYQQNKFILLTENLPVDDQTDAFTFWSFMSNLRDKFRRQAAQYKTKEN